MSKNAMLVGGGVLVVVSVLVIWGLTHKNVLSEKKNEGTSGVPVYSVTYDDKGESTAVPGGKDCIYTAHYNGKAIPLGTYPQVGSCEMNQTPRLSNGMLAVITQAYTFLYDPKTESVITLNPLLIPDFSTFAKEKGIDLYTDFPQKRFIFSGSTLQILYTRKTGDTTTPQMLSFVSTDNGKTFTFDRHTE